MVTRQSEIERGSPRSSWWNRIAKIVGIIGGILSCYLLFYTHCVSEVHVIAGKQVRLFVLANPEGCLNPQPLMLMSLVFSNEGGKTGIVFDSKLKVRLSASTGEKWEGNFKLLREFTRIPLGYSEDTQNLITPVAVLGMSNEARVYGFVPDSCINQENIPRTFDLEIQLFTQWQEKWESRGKYRADSITGIWQDLESDTTYASRVFDIIQVE